MLQIRRFEPKDVDAVYNVCLKTGDAGQDASHIFQDPKALGHLFVGPYMALEPDFSFVLEDAEGICGYTLGALDTKTFQQRYLSEWLPPLQKKYPDPNGDKSTWSEDQKIYHQIHHPEVMIPKSLEPYPSHLHIDLLPRAQGQGQGKKMIQTLLDALQKAKSPGVYLGLYTRNTRAFKFYTNLGFDVLETNQEVTYMGKYL